MSAPVIVGYDGRDASHDALALGSALVHGDGDLLTVCVCEEDHLSTPTDTRLTRERHTLSEGLRSEVHARRPPADGRAKAEFMLVPAQNPRAGLDKVAEERGCGALVVGSTHHGPVGRVLPGSTSGRLLNDGRFRVAVAPRGLALRETTIATIGVGVDGSPASDVALAASAELAAGIGARLVALTAESSPGSHLDSLALPSGGEIEVVKLTGSAAPALARAAEDMDLLIVGSRHGRHGLGSVSRELARHCPAPLLVVPERA